VQTVQQKLAEECEALMEQTVRGAQFVNPLEVRAMWAKWSELRATIDFAAVADAEENSCGQIAKT
tara:strand:- start:646 stop:840 length:195 start_codon:yes stop_codon:yes gene_type:complete